MLGTINDLTTSQLKSGNRIDEIIGSKMGKKYSSKEFRTRFFIPGTKLVFAKLKNTFNTASMSYYLI